MSSKLSSPRQEPWSLVWVKQVFELSEVELSEVELSEVELSEVELSEVELSEVELSEFHCIRDCGVAYPKMNLNTVPRM